MTANTFTKQITSVSILSFLLFSPFGYLAAQDNNVEKIGLESYDIASTTNENNSFVASFSTTTDEKWFKTEQLEGVIDQGDFVVGPGRVELEVKPGETIVYEISVTNRISDDRVFDLTVEDMAGSEDASEAVVLLGEEKGPYTVKDYITFPKDSFVLNLGERAKIPVTISIPEDAEPGGFYGGVLVSTVRSNEEKVENEAARSPIIARIGTLFFLTIKGDVETSGETKSLNTTSGKWWYEKSPINLSVLYENTGSVHLNPYGELRIKNLFGEEVGYVELEPWFVLPKSLRSRDIVWEREMLFGRYTATAQINRGYDDIVDEVSVTFWVLPWKVFLGLFLFIFVIIFSFRAFFRTFEFKRKN